MLSTSVLVLNKEYLPLHIISLKRALSLLYTGMAKAIDSNYQTFDFKSWTELSAYNQEKIGLVGKSIRVPRVILLTSCNYSPNRFVKFTRFNIYLRDKNFCQYCGKVFKKESLTLDHVIPKVKGGISSWKNIVCACLPCNQKKAGRTPREAGMTLKVKPVSPKWTPLFGLEGKLHEDWKPFLNIPDVTYWHLPLEEN